MFFLANGTGRDCSAFVGWYPWNGFRHAQIKEKTGIEQKDRTARILKFSSAPHSYIDWQQKKPVYLYGNLAICSQTHGFPSLPCGRFGLSK
jgi:hypothetical protein